MDVDLGPYFEVRIERSMQLSAAVLVVFEYFILFGDEVNLFWHQRWNSGKILFLWTRYFTLGFNISNAAVFMQNASEQLCMNFFHWQNSGATLQYITTQVIMSLRLYAMYGRSKKILSFLILLIVAEIAAIGCLFGIPQEGLIGTNEPLPGIFICADADPPDRHWMAYVPTIILATETILLVMALTKVGLMWWRSSAGRILPWLAKQSAIYFAVICLVHLTNQILWLENRITLNESVTAISFALPSVLAQRLLISVRQEQSKQTVVTSTGHALTSGVQFNTHGTERGATNIHVDTHNSSYELGSLASPSNIVKAKEYV